MSRRLTLLGALPKALVQTARSARVSCWVSEELRIRHANRTFTRWLDTADTALRLGLFFGMEPRFWLNLQSEYDIRVADRELRAKLSPRIRVFQPVAG